MNPGSGPKLRSRAVALTATWVVGVASAWAAPPAGPTEFPVGRTARPGRPVVVRVAGAAAVRIARGPWTAPSGARGDEFLLPAPAAAGGPLEFEIRNGTDREIESRREDVRWLSASGTVRAVFTAEAPRPEADGHVTVRVPSDGLPTLPEAWLQFDEVAPAPSSVHASVRDALNRWRALGQPLESARAAFQPWRAPPDASAYRAMDAAADATPALARDTAVALFLAAGAALVVAVTLRGAAPRVRAFAVSAAPIAAAVWLLATDRAVGESIVGTVLRVEGPHDVLVVLRLEGPGAGAAGRARIVPPPGAGAGAVVAFDESDAALDAVTLGPEIVVELAPGRTRLLAWREDPDDAAEPARSSDVGEPASPASSGGPTPLPAEVTAWLASKGLRPLPGLERTRGASAGPALRTDGIRLRHFGAVRVAARK